MRQRLNSREEKILIVCLTLVLVYVSYSIIFKPYQEKVRDIQAQLLKQNRQMEKDKVLLNKAKDLDRVYEDYLKRFKQTDTNEQVLSAILAEIEKVASELHLQISDLKPKLVKKEDYCNRFSVTLTLESELVDIVHFLYIIQQEPHDFSVEQVYLEKGTYHDGPPMRTELVLGKVFIP